MPAQIKWGEQNNKKLNLDLKREIWGPPLSDKMRKRKEKRGETPVCQQQERMKKFDLLKMDVIFVPMNDETEGKHWALAVVMHPAKAFERLTLEWIENEGSKEKALEHVTEDKGQVTDESGETTNGKTSPAPPSEDEPIIYLLCSLRKTQTLKPLCNIINRSLSEMILDESNLALASYREKLKERGIMKAPGEWAWDPAKHMLPFKYRMPIMPHQVNDYDCGVFGLWYIHHWFDDDRPSMDQPQAVLESWFPPRSIFDYRYDMRRVLDRLANEEEREPENENGKPEDHGYMETMALSLAERNRKLQVLEMERRMARGLDPEEEQWSDDEDCDELYESEDDYDLDDDERNAFRNDVYGNGDSSPRLSPKDEAEVKVELKNEESIHPRPETKSEPKSEPTENSTLSPEHRYVQ